MPRIRKEHASNYTVVGNELIQNTALSWKARGIIIYLLSMPENWEFNLSDLENRATEGRAALRSGIDELKEAGYIRIEKDRAGHGRFDGYTWWVFEEPKCENQPTVAPKVDFPKSDKPQTEKPTSDNRIQESKHPTKETPTKEDSAPGAPTPRPPKPKPKRPPSVNMFRQMAHRFPAKSWWDTIDTVVGSDEANLQRWGRVVYAWVGLGWKPTNVMGMVEFYQRNEIPGQEAPSGSRSKGNGKHGSQDRPLDQDAQAVAELFADNRPGDIGEGTGPPL